MSPLVVGALSATRLHYDAVWKTAQRLTTRPVKMGSCSAQHLDQQTVYVRADEALPYGTVMRVLGEMTAAGISRLSLVSVQKPPSRPNGAP